MLDVSKVTEDILKFWFVETPKEKRFAKDPVFDETIRKQFLPAFNDIRENGHERYMTNADATLAAIIILDQFSRNMFRDLPEAFSEDWRALTLAKYAVESGLDMATPEDQRCFFYMPFMHSEAPEDHMRAVAVFEAYGDAQFLEFELKHKAIIDRFGRYPHRNGVLGRASSKEEIAFVEEHGGF